MKKLIASFTFIFLILSLGVLVTGCKKEKKSPDTKTDVTVEVKKGNHTWYYFTQNTYKQTARPEQVPFQPQIPWTEAVRISSANNTVDSEGGSNKAFAVVNRLGMLSFEGEKITISQDVSLFSDRTAGNLIFLNDKPLFSVYKSSFFNNTVTDANYTLNQDNHLFLVQFDDIANISYPLINSSNITEEPNSEVTDFFWDGINFICSVKSITDSRNTFSYVKFTPIISLLNISPATAGNNLSVTPSDVDSFRNSKSQISYKKAPERVKSLLSGFSSEVPFNIEVKTAGGTSPVTYTNQVSGSAKNELYAKAILAQSWSAALFEDGTMFIEGALPGKHILRSGKPVAIRLPKLTPGFVYSDFVISGTTLYAAWEESNFYKTGRSGFLEVNLDKTLYSKIL